MYVEYGDVVKLHIFSESDVNIMKWICADYEIG